MFDGPYTQEEKKKIMKKETWLRISLLFYCVYIEVDSVQLDKSFQSY